MWPMLPPGDGNPFLHETAGGMLAAMAARAGEREAIVAPDRRITYAQLHREAQRVARGLLALGVKKNDKVALWLPTRPEWLFAQSGCAMIGAVVVALNTRYKAHELRYILRQSDATTLVCADHAGPVDYLETLAEVLPDLAASVPGELDLAEFPALRRVIVHADDPYPGCLAWRDIEELGDASETAVALDAARAAVTPDDSLTILYTSGTTSFPKGAIISHRNCLPHGWLCGAVMRLTFQPYGMTEVNAMALVHDLDEPPESLAVAGVWPADGLEARVVDPETGRDQPIDGDGELWLRGRLVTAGYYQKREETARAFSADGWFKTGDLAARHADGRGVFRGRLREVLRISHFMVAPGEIEAYLQTHPKVRQAFVIGVPDPRTNEAAVGYGIPHPRCTDLTQDEVIAHCRGRIASFKIPRHVRVVADVPRTPGPHGDKVQRARLREMFLGSAAPT